VATLEGFINNNSNSNDQELIELREENKKLRKYLRAEDTISNLIDCLTNTEERNNALTTYSRSVDSLLQKLDEINKDIHLISIKNLLNICLYTYF